MAKWLKILFAVFGLLLLAGGLLTWRLLNREPAAPRTITVESTTLVQDVEFTGHLAPLLSSDLSFEITGTIEDVLVNEGQAVKTGERLAILNPSLAELDWSKASADLAATAEQKNLAWQQAKQAAALTKKVNQQTLARRHQAVLDAKVELDQTRSLHQQTAAESGPSSLTESAVATLRAKETAYHAAQQTLTETQASAHQSDQTAAAAAEAARVAFLSTQQASSQATGLSSLAALQALATQRLIKTVLTAPYDGIITSRQFEPGETATAASPVVTIATADQLELSADVTETDATKLAVGLAALITFDALPPQDKWTAEVSFISPSAKTIEGVPTYAVKLRLLEAADPRLKSGLTANITVRAAEKNQTMAIPRRAVITQDTEQFVLVKEESGDIKRTPVGTGLVGTDGNIEITHGLSLGQQVIIDTATLRDQP